MLDVTASGRDLARRFLQLGNMAGKTADEIINVVGFPTARGSMAFGKTLLQWQATGYHIAILFDASGKFEKISSEYANFQNEPDLGGLMPALATGAKNQCCWPGSDSTCQV